MGRLSEPAVKTRFKAAFSKLKTRQRTKSTKMPAATVCDATDSDAQIALIASRMDDMEIVEPTNLPITPSGTFDFTPPPSCPRWPGPRYDDLVQFVPGIFNRSRDMMLPRTKTRPRRRTHKRSSSQDVKLSGAAHGTRRIDGKITKPATKRKSNQTRAPLFFPTPRTRSEPLHLFGLPGELRNQIYRNLYVSSSPLHAQYRSIMQPHRGTANPPIKRFPREPTLALVCRQLRQEASSLFYAENTFVFGAPAESLGDKALPALARMTNANVLARWMAASVSTASLTRVELCLGDSSNATSYAGQAVKYIFRALADGSTTVEQCLDEASRCVCFDRQLCKDVMPAMLSKQARGGENLLCAALLLMARRTAGLKDVVFEAGWEACGGCEKLGWR